MAINSLTTYVFSKNFKHQCPHDWWEETQSENFTTLKKSKIARKAYSGPIKHLHLLLQTLVRPLRQQCDQSQQQWLVTHRAWFPGHRESWIALETFQQPNSTPDSYFHEWQELLAVGGTSDPQCSFLNNCTSHSGAFALLGSAMHTVEWSCK